MERKEIVWRPYGMCGMCYGLSFLYETPQHRSVCGPCKEELKDQEAFSRIEREHYFGKSAPN